MQPEAEHGRAERAQHPDRLEVPEGGPERDAEAEALVEVGEVEPEDQLDDQRDRAEHPDVGPGDGLQDRAAGEPHRGHHGAQQEAQHGAVGGEFDRAADRPQDGVGGEVHPEGGPVPAGVGGQAVGELGQHDEGGEAGRPAPGVPGGDGAQAVQFAEVERGGGGRAVGFRAGRGAGGGGVGGGGGHGGLLPEGQGITRARAG